MCGIAGTLRRAGRPPVAEAQLEAMGAELLHRGPDGGGCWISGDCMVGLSHRRLAIIDPTPDAAQPMVHPSAEIAIVFNGEIYNHAELRRSLEREGERGWQTDHSDTEVLLRGFARHGPEFLHRLRGMFAFGLWDGRTHELWLVRDRLGIKPLYVAETDYGISFASEIKSLLRAPDVEAEVDEESLFHYLSFLTVPAPRTMFRGIHKLEAGTFWRVTPEGIVERRQWWDPWDGVVGQDDAGRPADRELGLTLVDHLRDAVAARKVADVPIGVFLSGGIDSSLNAVLFSENDANAVRTFSIGYNREYPDYPSELGHARRMADEVGAIHHELLLGVDDFIDLLPTMVALQDEPIADPVCVPVYYVSQLARQHGMVVAQVGEGSDELFWGYDSWRSMLTRQQQLDMARPAGASAARAVLRTMGRGGGFRGEYLRRASRGEPIFWGGAEAFPHEAKMRLLSPRLRERFRDLTSWDAIEPIHRRFSERAWEPSVLHWMTYIDLSLRLPELLLMRVDKMSMGNSLECRVPFLDHQVVQYALSLPQSVKTRDGVPKHILKQGVSGLLPDEIVHRPKQGFGVPIQDFFHERLGEFMAEAIPPFLEATDLLDPAEVERLRTTGASLELWYVLNLALWWRHYVGP